MLFYEKHEDIFGPYSFCNWEIKNCVIIYTTGQVKSGVRTELHNLHFLKTIENIIDSKSQKIPQYPFYNHPFYLVKIMTRIKWLL